MVRGTTNKKTVLPGLFVLVFWSNGGVWWIINIFGFQANSNDEDGGVLEGRWSDPYPKGTTVPWAWSGSVSILTQFWKTKKTVKFGQCWVFSGLVTTCEYKDWVSLTFDSNNACRDLIGTPKGLYSITKVHCTLITVISPFCTSYQIPSKTTDLQTCGY